ncbi:hypothetical protein BS78_K061600 [Paspalum vaginatum]|uniref:Uncharacterized protein n=1 Tax=Paspalum vaginatum TaxID=158149 RepID=A0A9W7X716_9POAL|nr:hypothetical protein BS78_K061600 [Paspalum vaginatum]
MARRRWTDRGARRRIMPRARLGHLWPVRPSQTADNSCKLIWLAANALRLDVHGWRMAKLHGALHALICSSLLCRLASGKKIVVAIHWDLCIWSHLHYIRPRQYHIVICYLIPSIAFLYGNLLQTKIHNIGQHL